MDSWIRCRVDLYAFFLFVCFLLFFFFSLSLKCFSILCYASGFYMLLFFRQMFLTRARTRMFVCVLFIGIVQRNWACLTWKSALEIKSLLLLLLSRVPDQNGVSQAWYYRDTPFWSETLDILLLSFDYHFHFHWCFANHHNPSIKRDVVTTHQQEQVACVPEHVFISSSVLLGF